MERGGKERWMMGWRGNILFLSMSQRSKTSDTHINQNMEMGVLDDAIFVRERWRDEKEKCEHHPKRSDTS